MVTEVTNMTNINSMLKSRDITLSTKGHLVKAMVLSLVMEGYDIPNRQLLNANV